jgi:5-methylthioribose kinase
MKKILRDTIGFAGCKMVRRIVGLAHVADIDTIADPQVRAHAETIALNIGKALIKLNRKAESIEEVIAIAEQYAK